MSSRLQAVLFFATVLFFVFSISLSIWELDWKDYAIINDVTVQSKNGDSYRVLRVDGRQAVRMKGRFESRAPLVLNDTGVHNFEIERTENGIVNA